MASAYDLRAWNTFDDKSKQTMLAGGTVTGGDGRQFVWLNGHATTVGSATYKAGMAQREANRTGGELTPGQKTKRGPMTPAERAEAIIDRPKVPGRQPDPAEAVKDDSLTPEEQRRAEDDAARQRDARARIGSVLAEYGLESMADWVWQQIVAGKSDAEVLQDLRNTPEFKQRFPAIEERRKKGLNAISPGEYVTYERQARQLMRAAGLPEGFYDSNDDFTRYIAGDMSLAELNDRIGLARRAQFEVDAQTRQTLQRDYGIGEGELTAWFLDDKVAQPLLEKRFTAGQLGAAASRSGFGITTREENEGLAEIGVTAGEAQEGFGTLAGMRELTRGLPGQREEDISREDQLGAVFRSDANARSKIENRRSKRQATFRGGGGFASDRDGVSGLGQVERV